ncbi:MAG: aminoacyl-tRNA hydrolase [Spirochaetia bacterium]|nr:aminoacyl-tRNA hydrolase [Spirochaetia bacterium]MCI7564950.1 aminoacyl-tRNA hydrolase [Spirochaetia bacterium]
MIQLVVFLGNYGSEYSKTRHNVAWQFLDSLPFSSRFSWQQKFKGEFLSFSREELSSLFCESKILCAKDGSPVKVSDNAPPKVYFLKPLTYMNNSGLSAIEFASFFKIKPEEILVVHDELEMALGFVSLKFSGGLGGHNGLRSMKSVFNTPDFWRLRFGLSKPSGVDIADYVLSPFSQDERIVLDSVFTQTHNLFAEILLSSSPEKLLQNWSKKKLCEL